MTELQKLSKDLDTAVKGLSNEVAKYKGDKNIVLTIRKKYNILLEVDGSWYATIPPKFRIDSKRIASDIDKINFLAKRIKENEL